MSKATSHVSIREWYRGRSLLVTGGTGFMGKILMEKVIRVLPIEKLYVIIREKRGVQPQDRIKNILQLPIFDKIRGSEPALLEKIVALDGDVTSPNLGLNTKQIQELKDNVSVVFHNAASLKLEADLKHAISFNLKGTKNVMEFCLQLPKVESVLHLSTAFCHVDVDVLEEKIYPSSDKPDDVIHLVDTLDKKSLDMLQASLISPHPNCYTFSKRLAETVIEEYSTKLPLTIVRPSIVIPALYEPIPGWVDSLNGPIGLLVAGGKGVIRTMMVDEHNLANVIPVDICINGMIIAAFERSFKQKFGLVDVYNATTSHDIINYTWRDVLEKGKKVFYKYPFDWPVIWYPDGDMTTNKYVHYFLAFMLHTIPAYFIDFLMFIFFQPRFMVYVHKRIALGLELLQYFTMRNWIFKNQRFVNLPSRLNKEEEYSLCILSREYDIDDYLLSSILGARQYCVKDDLSSLPRARRILKFLYVLHITTKTLFFYFILNLVLSIFNLNFLLSPSYWSNLIGNTALQGVKLN